MKFSVILLMAGEGSRMKINKNKVLLPYKNKPIYEVSLDLFRKYTDEIICVTNPNDNILISNVIQINGGKSRQESVFNALEHCTNDYVLIHDAARPLLAKDVLEEIINKIDINKAILTCGKVKDTIKINNNNHLETLDRNKLLAASTPQGAAVSVLLNCHIKAINDNLTFTDDISMIEKYYSEINIDMVYQNEENFKITTPLDYKLLTLLGEEND